LPFQGTEDIGQEPPTSYALWLFQHEYVTPRKSSIGRVLVPEAVYLEAAAEDKPHAEPLRNY
jgi:hypothetical protein